MSLRQPLLQLKPRSDRPAPPITAAFDALSASGLTLAASLVESDDLLRGGREVLIRHGDEVYRLRHTRNDKLILTK
ncbi:hemin uptake protein HemP [Lysobacter sp. TAF61]|uniref:hemin uptake protein HemP n=1 Tax=Lysobacter sp. TAF61 TaxID=3233072 RepID=UPI003F96DD0B